MISNIKDFCLSILSEQDDSFMHVDADSVGNITDIHYNKAENYVKVDFETTYGKKSSLVTQYTDFEKWYAQNKDNYTRKTGTGSNKNLAGKELFKGWIKDFLKTAKETENPEKEVAGVKEIIDADGNIMGDGDGAGNNSTNSMVGTTLKGLDLDKVYRSSIPKSIRFYSGDLGIGIITW